MVTREYISIGSSKRKLSFFSIFRNSVFVVKKKRGENATIFFSYTLSERAELRKLEGSGTREGQ